ncbi:MAG TPA: acyl-CoA dehydrogenase family protein, partial [Actinomycetota bacterium]|nr:acyl-CoA dehydrogenase family protein [Actinomycetota bacterium]
MDFEFSSRSLELQERLGDFITTHVDPAGPVYQEQVAASGDPHFHPPVMEELKAEARKRGLWNLFLPNEKWGAGLSNLDYAPLCEMMGKSLLTGEATNCAAPDTGNMEILAEFGTAEQQDEWLVPLLEGRIRSCFAMTEPWVASSDATNIQSRIEPDGDHYIVNAHKWWTSGAASDRCKVAVLLGVSDPDADPYHRHSMILVPFDAP